MSVFVQSSDMIGVDLPLCRECTRQVESQLIRDVSETQRELERYQSFVQQLEEQGLHTDSALVAEKQMQLEIASVRPGVGAHDRVCAH